MSAGALAYTAFLVAALIFGAYKIWTSWAHQHRSRALLKSIACQASTAKEPAVFFRNKETPMTDPHEPAPGQAQPPADTGTEDQTYARPDDRQVIAGDDDNVMLSGSADTLGASSVPIYKNLTGADAVEAARADGAPLDPDPILDAPRDTTIDVPLTDDEPTGQHAAPTPAAAYRVNCPTCQGTGHIDRTVTELLQESIALIPDGGGDQVIKEFYFRLLQAAPDLAKIFPKDLLTGPAVNSRGNPQRDRLYAALAALATLYNPADQAAMDRLETALAAFGRSHANFDRLDGTVRGATPEEYAAVKTILIATFHAVAGAAWRPEYDAAWAEAYDHAWTIMAYHQRKEELANPDGYARTPRQ